MPVGMLARFPLLVVVAPDVPAKDWKEFVAWAKSKPEGVNYASAGIGSPHHLAGELLREKTGLKMIHTPYRGAAPAVQDLLGGQVPFGIMDTASVVQHLASGKLKAIGVASPQRLKSMSTIPTLTEQGVAGFEAYAWQGLVVPAGTKPETVAQLNKALVDALESPQREGALPGPRARGVARHARADGQLCEERARALGQADQGQRHQAGLK